MSIGDLLIAIFDDPNDRQSGDRSHQETAPTRDHKVAIPNVCGSDLLIAIFVTVHVEYRHRMNRWGDAYVVRLQRYRLLSNQG